MAQNSFLLGQQTLKFDEDNIRRRFLGRTSICSVSTRQLLQSYTADNVTHSPSIKTSFPLMAKCNDVLFFSYELVRVGQLNASRIANCICTRDTLQLQSSLISTSLK